MKRHRSTSSPKRGKTGEAGASRAKVVRDSSGPTVGATAAGRSTTITTTTTSSSVSGNETTALNNNNNNIKSSTFLSKNALYTPLLAYDQTKVEPSLYLGTKSSIPNSLQETSLVNFLRTVSLEYHYQPSSSSVVGIAATATCSSSNPFFIPPYISHRNDCKHVGGSQAVALSKMEERIRQRTVTLLGGGIHVTAAKLKATALLKLETNQPRQQNLGGLGRRRRQERQRQRQLLYRQNLTGKTGNTTTTLHNLPSDDNKSLGEPQESSSPPLNHHPHQTYYQLDFVRELNMAWNDYMILAISALEGTTVAARNTKKVGNGNNDDDDDDDDDDYIALWKTLSHQFFAASSSLSSSTSSASLEWVGAHVQVLACAQRLSLVHQNGVIVGQTLNTWTVAMVQPQTRPPRRSHTTNYLLVTNTEDPSNETTKDMETCNDTSPPPIMPTKEEEQQQQQQNQHTWTIRNVMIPKRGTSIGLLIRIPCTNSNNSVDPHSTTMMATMIPTLTPNSPSPTLCIVVEPPTTHSVSLLKR
jgi:hypothetical protein